MSLRPHMKELQGGAGFSQELSSDRVGVLLTPAPDGCPGRLAWGSLGLATTLSPRHVVILEGMWEGCPAWLCAGTGRERPVKTELLGALSWGWEQVLSTVVALGRCPGEESFVSNSWCGQLLTGGLHEAFSRGALKTQCRSV